MMKYLKCLVVSLCMMCTLLLFDHVRAQGLDKYTHEMFFERVSKESFVNKYIDKLTKMDPLLFVEKDNLVSAYYEVILESKETIQSSIDEDLQLTVTHQINSLLVVSLDKEHDTINGVVFDYSMLEQTGNVIIKNIVNGEEEHILGSELNNTLDETWENMSLAKSSMIVEIENDFQMSRNERALHCNWWMCTKYDEGGGYISGDCDWVDSICNIALLSDKIPKESVIVCEGAKLILCYVPHFKHCVSGYWETRFCPQRF